MVRALRVKILCIVEYPWKENPKVLGNNVHQVERIMYSTERHFLKSKDAMGKFNGQIMDFESRKVLHKITVEEGGMDIYTIYQFI